MKMAFVGAGNLLAGSTTIFNNFVGRTVYPCIFDQVRQYAARPATRLRKLKLAKQAKLVKTRKILKMMEQRKQKELRKFEPIGKLLKDDILNGPPVDDVWSWVLFQWPVYTVDEAVNAFHETFHPTIYNKTNPVVNAFIEFDMTADKKGKYIKTFSRMCLLPHVMPPKIERKIVAFSSHANLYKEALALGANVVGGKDLIKQIQAGNVDIKHFDFYLADVDALPDLLLIKGLLKDNVPSFKKDTLGTEILPLIAKFKNGLEYTVKAHEHYPQYGTCIAPIGFLGMGPEILSSNLTALVQDICVKRPKFRETFVTRIQLQCPPSNELFKVQEDIFVPKFSRQKQQKHIVEEEHGHDTASVIVASD